MSKNFGSYDNLALYFSGAMLLALFVLAYFHKMGTYGVETDFYWSYAPDARNMLQGKLPEEPGVGPGYGLVLILFNFLIKDWFISGKAVSIFSTVLGGYFTFRLLRDLFDSRLGFFTLILWHVTVLPFSIIASTDMFFAGLVASSIYFLFRNNTITTANLLISGLLMGFAYLTRPNAVVLPIAVVLILLLINPESWRPPLRFKNLAIFAAIFLFVNLPWMVIQSVSTGTAVRNDSYLLIASNFYGKPGVIVSEDMRKAAQQFDSLSSVIFYDFPYFVKHYILNIYHHFHDLLINSLKFPSFLFAVAGAVFLFPRLNKKQLSVFLFPATSFLLLCLVHYEPRYYLYIISFFIFPVVYCLFFDAGFAHRESRVDVLRLLRGSAFTITVLIVLVFSLKEVKANINEEPRELLEISKFLHGNVRENGTIIARKPHLGFLLNLRTIYFPETTTLPGLLKYASAEKADYLLYGEIEADRRPELRVLLEPENLPRQFEPMYVWDNPKTVIYRFRNDATN